MIIDKIIDRVQKVQDEIDNYLLDEVKHEEDFVLDLNRSQLDTGVDAKSKGVAPPYTPYTKTIKRFKGQPTNRVTLKDTGDFHRSFFLVFGDDYFEIDAKDAKVDDLEEKYGDDILGLTPENIDAMTKRIKDPFLTTLKEVILK